MAWFVPFLIGMAIAVVGYLLMPKPKQPKPDAAKDMEGPTAEAGRPVPVVFGTLTVKGSNALWDGEKRLHEYTKKEGSGGKK